MLDDKAAYSFLQANQVLHASPSLINRGCSFQVVMLPDLQMFLLRLGGVNLLQDLWKTILLDRQFLAVRIFLLHLGKFWQSDSLQIEPAHILRLVAYRA